MDDSDSLPLQSSSVTYAVKHVSRFVSAEECINFIDCLELFPFAAFVVADDIFSIVRHTTADFSIVGGRVDIQLFPRSGFYVANSVLLVFGLLAAGPEGRFAEPSKFNPFAFIAHWIIVLGRLVTFAKIVGESFGRAFDLTGQHFFGAILVRQLDCLGCRDEQSQ